MVAGKYLFCQYLARTEGLYRSAFLSYHCICYSYFAGFMLIINHVTMFYKIKNFKNIQEVNMCNINFYPFTSPLIFLSKITLLLHLLNSCRVWDWTQALTHLRTNLVLFLRGREAPHSPRDRESHYKSQDSIRLCLQLFDSPQ